MCCWPSNQFKKNFRYEDDVKTKNNCVLAISSAAHLSNKTPRRPPQYCETMPLKFHAGTVITLAFIIKLLVGP
jgi:hypothetical protein